MKSGFICEKCGMFSENINDIRNCESTHINIEDMKIRHASDYYQLKWPNLTTGKNRIPKKIVIEFSDKYGIDAATYTIEHYGSRGV